MARSENTPFHDWLREHDLSAYDFSGVAFPPASDRAFWDGKYDPEMIANGEQFLQYAWPLIKATDYMAFAKTGARLPQETPHLTRRSALLSLLLAEILEHKGRFLPDLVDGLFLITEETYSALFVDNIDGNIADTLNDGCMWMPTDTDGNQIMGMFDDIIVKDGQTIKLVYTVVPTFDD